MEKIIIGSTRAGLKLKKEIISYLEGKGFQLDDVGMKEGGEFIPYHRSSMAVSQEISKKKYKRGIIICGTGAGSVIVAAKYKGVYPVHVTNTYMAEKAKSVNNCNVLVFGEWLTPPEHAFAMIDVWMNTEFTDGVTDDWKKFLSNSVEEIKIFENDQFK